MSNKIVRADAGTAISRAAFIRACGGLLLGAQVEPLALLEAAAQPSAGPERASAGGRFGLHDADARMFRPHLNTAFRVRSSDGTRVRLVLAEVVERPLTRNVEQFSLIFHAPARAAVPHGLHAFEHQALGGFELFIVPIGAPNGRRTVYQACFSRVGVDEAGRAADAAAPLSRRT